MRKWLLVVSLLIVVGGGGVALIPVGGANVSPEGDEERSEAMDMTEFSAEPPGKTLRLLFIHHSVGGQLLAPVGPDVGQDCIYESHPNGGGLRADLTAAGYEVHEASYNSIVGGATDTSDWLPTFRDRMDRVLRTDRQDGTYDDERTNDIVVFKSCYPNNRFEQEGTPPGDPLGTARTVWNTRAALMALREQFASRPDVLFVYVTTPPTAPRSSDLRLFRHVARRLLRRPRPPSASDLRRWGDLSRQLDNWVRSPEGWLEGYEHRNIAVFDYYDVLTGHGRSNLLMYATGGGYDSHPSSEGNEGAAREFLPLLNRAVRRAGLVE